MRSVEANSVPDHRRRRPWLVAVPFVLLILLGAAWSGFWFVSASATKTILAGWQDREASRGRTYRCGERSISGFPFRFELRCKEPSAEFRGTTPPAALAAKDAVLVAQIWQPDLVIGELTGPLEVSEPGQPTAVSLTWSLAQASLRGLPSPERSDVVVERPMLVGRDGAISNLLAQADRAELHVRLAEGSARQNPVLDLAVTLDQAFTPRLGSASAPFDADVVGVLRGLSDLSPRSLRETLRGLQAANGRLDITRARVQMGDIVATGEGVLSLSPRGALDGELQVTVVNVERLLPLLGVDRLVNQLMPQSTRERLAPGLDRLVPGLGAILRGNGGEGTAAEALGPKTQLEGKNAVKLPLRFTDGTVTLGPFRIAQLAPLY